MAKLTIFSIDNRIISHLLQNIKHQELNIQSMAAKIEFNQSNILLYNQKLNELNESLNVRVIILI